MQEITVQIPDCQHSTNCPEQWRLDNHSDQIRYLESKLDRVIANQRHGADVVLSLSNVTNLIGWLAEGKPIQAIKFLRECVPGLSLKEAKDQVDTLKNNFNFSRRHW